MDTNELQRLIAEYLATLDEHHFEERWESDRSYATEELENFTAWLAKRQQARSSTST